jgi:hypothetical protein
MTTGLNYTQYVSQISTMAVVEPTNTAFQSILTQMITYAENRMYRDLDFLFTSGSSTAYGLTAGSRTLNVAAATFPYGTLVVPEQINVLSGVTPALFNASISGVNMSVSAVTSGTIVAGMEISGTGVAANTFIVSGAGLSWTVSVSQNVSTTSMNGVSVDLATRVPLLPTTKEFLDAVYGSGAVANRGLPQYWVPFDDYTFLVGPYPDQDYSVELVGTYRPQSLGYLPSVVSASGGQIVFSSAHGLANNDLITLYGFVPTGWNTTFSVTIINSTTVSVSSSAGSATTIGTAASTNSTTFISLNLPDIMIMASMIYISAYQRNFGRANDDPQMAITYESQYQALLKGAMVEEARKKFEAAGWSSQSPSPVATPSRG